MKQLILLVLLLISLNTFAQDDLMNLLEANTEAEIVYTESTFKGSRLINGHTVQNRKAKALEFLISHRFGRLNTGSYEFWGLDGANIRLGLDYGITDFITVGLGRNSFEKTYDSFLKWRLLRQSSGKRKMPVSVVYFTSVAYKTLREEEDFQDKSSKLFYTHQFLIAHKFSNNFSLQMMPTLVHRNRIEEEKGDNDVYALGAGGRLKLTQRLSLNMEYYHRFNTIDDNGLYNSVAMGFAIETGGHVFQLHFTNSRTMIEKGFITETTGDLSKGDVHFGFNITRVF